MHRLVQLWDVQDDVIPQNCKYFNAEYAQINLSSPIPFTSSEIILEKKVPLRGYF